MTAAETVAASGAAIPRLGFGTWQLNGDTAVRCVEAALAAGYRHIDTAAMYGNEGEVGQAIRAAGVPRDELFLTTKVWPSDMREADCLRSAERSVRLLGVDQIDLLLIHWPSNHLPLKEQVRSLGLTKTRGLTRHIGVSNFPVRLLEQALSISEEPLATDQVEHHPHVDQSALLEFCRGRGMALTSYSPIAKGALLGEPVLVEVARAKGKTPAQVVLRWHMQQPGNVAIPRSSNPKRIVENIDIFDFELSPDEMAQISGLAR